MSELKLYLLQKFVFNNNNKNKRIEKSLFLLMCMYSYRYVCMYVFIYVCIHICMYVCMYVCMCAFYISACVCVRACVSVSVCARACVSVSVSVSMCVCVKSSNTSTHSNIITDVHIYINSLIYTLIYIYT